jgi:hypothetical protein
MEKGLRIQARRIVLQATHAAMLSGCSITSRTSAMVRRRYGPAVEQSLVLVWKTLNYAPVQMKQ